MTPEEIESHNRFLDQMGSSLFGGKATLRIVAPKSLVLLGSNARYFKKEAFQQLVANIRKDERLSSVPLCRTMEDGRLEVLSGNHRVKGSIEAGVAWILVMVILEDLAEGERIAIQLSHNALVGLDDPTILADLWGRIQDIADKLYSGLSSDVVQELEKIKLTTFSTPQPCTKAVSFVFTTVEQEKMEDVLRELAMHVASGAVHLCPMEQFEAFFTLLQRVKRLKGVKNTSSAMAALIEIARKALTEEEACS